MGKWAEIHTTLICSKMVQQSMNMLKKKAHVTKRRTDEHFIANLEKRLNAAVAVSVNFMKLSNSHRVKLNCSA